MSKKAIFLVLTPLNITCAQQAIYDFNISEALFIVYPIHNNQRSDQVLLEIKKLKDSKVKTKVLLTEKNQIASTMEERVTVYIKHIDNLRQQNFDLLFFSKFNELWQEDMVKAINIKNSYLIDDGAATLNYFNFFYTKGIFFQHPQYPITTRPKIVEEIKQKYKITEDFDCKNIKIYTFFESIVNNKNILLNSLSHIKKTHKPIDKNLVYILGTALFSLYKISEDIYIENIRQLLETIPKDKNIIYYGHRSESETFIKKLEKLDSRITTIYNSELIEIHFTNQNSIPYRTISFLSTSLFLLEKYFPNINLEYMPFTKKINAQLDTFPINEKNTRLDSFKYIEKCLPSNIKFLTTLS